MTPKPNSAYLLSPSGVIVYRAHWANDERGLRSALTDVAAGQPPTQATSRGMIRPLLRAVGHLPGIVAFAGRRVERDVWLAAPPLAILGRLSRLFGRLPADQRGTAATVLLLLAAATGIIAFSLLR